MKQTFFSLLASIALLTGIFVTTTSAEARGGGFACHGGGGGASFSGTHGGTFGGCIRSPGTFGHGPICGPYHGYHPRYGYGYGGFGYGFGGGWNWNLPCYDGGSPYMCDIKPPPPPPVAQYIYQGGTVMREYGAARAPGMSPVIINEYKSSPGAKPTVIGQ